MSLLIASRAADRSAGSCGTGRFTAAGPNAARGQGFFYIFAPAFLTFHFSGFGCDANKKVKLGLAIPAQIGINGHLQLLLMVLTVNRISIILASSNNCQEE